MFLINAMIESFRVWKLYNKTRSELSRLDDRMLADIGFSRSEIERVAMQAANA